MTKRPFRDWLSDFVRRYTRFNDLAVTDLSEQPLPSTFLAQRCARVDGEERFSQLA